QCLKLLCDYFPINIYSPNDFFPINIYSPNDFNIRIETTQPTMFHSLFFNKTKDTLILEQLTTMNISTDFIRQYLSTCIMDPITVNVPNNNTKKIFFLIRLGSQLFYTRLKIFLYMHNLWSLLFQMV
ncbi:unnamed protein product, partial [Rotaria sordida]